MVQVSPETIAKESEESPECWAIWLCEVERLVVAFEVAGGFAGGGGAGFWARIDPATIATSGTMDATRRSRLAKPGFAGTAVSASIRSTRRLTVAGLAMATPAEAGWRFFAKSRRISAYEGRSTSCSIAASSLAASESSAMRFVSHQLSGLNQNTARW